MPKTDWKARLGFKNLDILKDFTPPEVIKKFYPGGYFGYDITGSPVFIDPIGKVDFKGLLHSVKGDELLKMRMLIAERGIQLCKQQSDKLKKDIKQVTIIADLDGLGLKHTWKPGVRLFNTIATLFEDDYPDLMKHTLVINAPRVFPVIFALVKPFLREETKRKIKVLGSNWKSELLNYISAEQLPVYYGGAAHDEDCDPMCRKHICYGGDVPKSYYANMESTEMDGLDYAFVKHGDQLELEYKVNEPGSVLHWYFKTEGYDIAFGIYHKDTNAVKDGKMKEVIALDKRQSHLMPEDGYYTCNKNGIYIVKFDNSYSWTKSKKLHYQVGLTASSEGL